MHKKKIASALSMKHSTATISVKVYEEQMPNGWEYTKSMIGKTMDIRGVKVQILAICHNRDLKGDDRWEPSIEKPHYHIIARVINRKERIYVASFLADLGIVFRKGLDESMMENHGLETVADFTEFAVYLTHETEKAMNEGKTKYEVEEIVANVEPADVLLIREGYLKLEGAKQKVTDKEMEELSEKAYEAGRNLESWDEFWHRLSYKQKKNAGMRVVEKEYWYGLEERMEKRVPVERLCIFITSEKGVGKSVAVEKYLEQKNLKTLLVAGGGSGKLDRLKPSTEAIFCDDEFLRNLKNLGDSRAAFEYRRNSSNPPWCGKVFIAVHNMSFRDWVLWCNEQYCEQCNYDAVVDRFFICHISKLDGVPHLICDKPCTRHNAETTRELYKRFIEFRDIFNESIREYHFAEKAEDLPNLNEYDGKNYDDFMIPTGLYDIIPKEPIR